MLDAATRGEDVAKKKPSGQAKRYGTLIRVDDESAEAIKEVSRLEGLSIAEYFRMHVLPSIRKRYRDVILRKAKKLGGEE